MISAIDPILESHEASVEDDTPVPAGFGSPAP